MRIKKSKKSKGMRGGSTHGHGARKKWKKSGHRGGVGMAGTGKRADQRKTYVLAKYGSDYFGKQGVTSRGTAKKKNDCINVGDIVRNFSKLQEKYGSKGVLDLSTYKILGKGEVTGKLHLKAQAISESAKEKIERAGGSVVIVEKKEHDTSNKK